MSFNPGQLNDKLRFCTQAPSAVSKKRNTLYSDDAPDPLHFIICEVAPSFATASGAGIYTSKTERGQECTISLPHRMHVLGWKSHE